MTTQQQRVSTRPGGVLARCVLAARAGVLSLTRRSPLAADAALAALLLVLALPPLTGMAGRSHALSLALILAMVVPLAGRRLAPVVICLAVTVLAVVQLFPTGLQPDDLAILVAFYTVAASAPARLVLACGAALEAGVVVAAATWTGTGLSPLRVLVLATALIAAAGGLGYYVRTARGARAASAAAQARRLERDREQQAELAVAAERARIARELHDIVAHHIAMMITLSDGAAASADGADGVVPLMREVSAAGRAALTEMRLLLGVLRQPATAERGPQPGLADLGDLLAGVRNAGLPVRLDVTGEPAGIPASTQLALYRLVQEALTNSIKHAPGARAQVRLGYRPGEVELEVTDDGGAPGQAGAAAQPGSGHGITGMRERAAVFGGRVAAGPAAGGGWRVHAVLPVSNLSEGNDR